MTEKPTKDLLSAVEDVFLEVMQSKKSTIDQKVDAAKEAVKLLLAKKKIDDSGNDSGSFFK